MPRPVMEPIFVEADEPARPTPNRVLPGLLSHLRSVSSAVWALLTFELLGRSADENDETAGRLGGLARRLVYWTALAPAGLLVVVIALCHSATHPTLPTIDLDPGSLGVFYDAVTVAASEQRRLDAWLVQPLDAERVLHERERALRRRFPAAVLVPDHGCGPQLMLPLIRPLRDAGFVVLVIHAGRRSDAQSPSSTFGVEESKDVLAAVHLLRQQTFVDPDRVVLIGAGSGANAAALAARDDGRVRCVVLDGPLVNAGDAVSRHVLSSRESLTFLADPCRWVLQVVYGIDLDELQLDRVLRQLDRRPVLVFAAGDGPRVPGETRARHILGFLSQHVGKSAQAVSSTSAIR